jgi:hypothetical protein
VDKLPDGRIEVKAAAPKGGDISDLFGIAKRPGQPTVSLEDIDDAIRKGWAGEL